MLEVIRWAFGAACAACNRPLLLGAIDTFCEACAPSVVSAGRWSADANGWRVAAAYGYAGAMTTAIVRAKNGGGRVDLRTMTGQLAKLTLELQANERDVALVPVPPQRQRLVERGMHLPDLIAAGMAQRGRQVVRALDRLDLQAPRRAERLEPPQFRVRVRPARRREAIVIDDVVTTGQTVGLAAEALQQAGWRVLGAVCLADARPAVLAELLSGA